jgi:hypothetical protein
MCENEAHKAKQNLEEKLEHSGWHPAILAAASHPGRVPLTKRIILGLFFKLTHCHALTGENKKGTMFLLCSR